MHIRGIEIKGFRGINRLKIENFKDINLFVGKNNCGKSSLLEAIFLIVGMSNPENILKVNRFRGLLPSDREDMRLIFHNLDFKSDLSIKAWMNKPNTYRKAVIRPSNNEEITNENKSSKNTVRDVATFYTGISKDEFNELILSLEIKSGSKHKDYEARLVFKEDKYKIVLPGDYTESFNGRFSLPNETFNINLEKILDSVIKNKRENEIVSLLSEIDPQIKGILFGANHMIYIDNGVCRLPLQLFGDGAIRVLELFLSIIDMKDGFLFVDEIENGLHFSILKLIWKFILDYSKKYRVQVFATTHNIETLKYLKEALEEGQNEDRQRAASITLRRFDKFSFAIEQGVEIR